MPLSFRQAGNLFVAGPNITIFPSGNTFAISGSASGGGGGGVTGLTSAGTGNRLIFSSLTNNNTVLVQKSLSGGTGIAIIDSGTGTLTFSSTSTASGTIISGTNAGTGVAIFSSASGSNLVFRRILSGTNIGVYLSGNDIVISGSSGAINGVTGVTNVGTGSILLSSVTSGVLIARTISGSNGIEVVESGSNIIVRPVTTTTANRLFFAGTNGALTTNSNFGADVTRGSLGIGGAASTTSRLAIAAGTASISQIRLQKSPFSVSSPNDGDIYYITTGDTLKFEKDTIETDFFFKDKNYFLTSTTPTKILMMTSGGSITTKNVVDFGVFNTVSSLTISDTTSEISIISTQLVTGNTKTLYATNDLTNPQLVIGKKFRFNAKGIFSSIEFTQATFKVKLGSTIISSGITNSSFLVGNIENVYF
jgi:hypothetical protein